MKKLVTALIIVLPLVLIIALFAITGIVRISADIPATGITIANRGDEGVFVFDISRYSAPLFESDLGVEVQPRAARDKSYSLSITDVSGINESEIVTRDDNGAFRLHDVGVAKLTFTSRDGGYSESVLFNVTASSVIDFKPVLTDCDGKVLELEKGTDTDYAITLESGSYTLRGDCRPSAVLSANVIYECSNVHILDFIDTNGQFNANFCGNTVVKMTVDGAEESMSKSISVTVIPSGEVTINGNDATKSQARIKTAKDRKTVTFGVQTSRDTEDCDISVRGELDSYEVRKSEGAENAFYVTVKLSEPYSSPVAKAYKLSLGAEEYDFFIDYADRDLCVTSPTNADGKGDITTVVGASMRLAAVMEPYEKNVRYEWELSEGSTFEILSQKDGVCFIKATEAGEVDAILKWTAFDDNGDVITTGRELRTVKAVKGYSSLLFAENADTYGKGMLAIASDKYENGAFVQNVYKAKFKTFDENGRAMNFDDLEFSSSDENTAVVCGDENGVYISVKGSGTATVSVGWKYGRLFAIKPATFTFTAVDGVQATCDRGLRAAFAANKPAVLTEDVYLGENLFDIGANGARTPKFADEIMREKLLSYTGEIKTTADWKYYENIKRPQPSVRYCLDITSNLYGNGHTISAEYITNMLDATDKPYEFAVFKGPLDFISSNAEGIKVACVKGQDNISFLVRNDGVVIDNVILKGCDDETIYDDGSINLSYLNYVGTTLEIMSDATVSNSRIMNGRTVLRVFGREGISETDGINPKAEKIDVTVDGCVLQNAREFLLKTGTNRFIRGSKKKISPTLISASGKEYVNYNSPACDEYVNDEEFMSDFVLTEIILKDSTLRTSGLLSVGIESHFAGLMLQEDNFFHLQGWDGLAATSYPALLRLVGDVVIADWKDIAAVDSSTLIEVNTTDPTLSYLALNMSEMLKAVQIYGGDGYKNIIDQRGNTSFVHGGIAFYGGGKNYSIVDMSQYTFEKMNQYAVNLSILKNSPVFDIRQQGAMLPLAAGEEDFRFILFDSTSKFNIYSQDDYL